MSWDVRWTLRWPAVDEARFAAAVRATMQAAGVSARIEATVDRIGCVAELPRAYVERHHMPGFDVLPDDDTFWIEIDLDCMEVYPLVDGEPFEVLETELVDEFGEPARRITSVCTIGDTPYCAGDGAGFAWYGTSWHAIARDDEDSFVRGIGAVDGAAWCVGSGVYRVNAGALAAFDRPGDARSLDLVAITGTLGDLYVASEIGPLFHHDGTRWSIVPGCDEIGAFVGFARASSGLYIATYGEALQRLDRGTATRPDWAPIWDTIDIPDAIGVGIDGHVWLAGNGATARWDGGAFTCEPSPVAEPRALVRTGDDLFLLGRDRCARWDGERWQPFEAALTAMLCAAAGPDGTILVGREGGITTLEPRGPFCELCVSSNRSANREAWGAATQLAGDIARRLGAGPAR